MKFGIHPAIAIGAMVAITVSFYVAIFAAAIIDERISRLTRKH
jgi:hypothetical protein